METVDPRKVLKDLVKLLDYTELHLQIIVNVYDHLSDDTHSYVIRKINNKLDILVDNSELNVDNTESFLKVIERFAISSIELENPYTEILIFNCEGSDCMDFKRAKQTLAGTKIQKAFHKSRDYAAWAYSPERLKEQGYFDNVEFGKSHNIRSKMNRLNSEIRYLQN